MAVKREGTMKTLAWIALIVVLGLSGCASSGTGGYIRGDWIAYWENPGDAHWKSIKGDWTEFWNAPGGLSWKSIKGDWTGFWN